MRNFNYRCIDDHGKRREGSITGVDAKAAEKELRERGWTILSLDGETMAKSVAPVVRTALKASERARFLLKISLLLEAGLSILKALEGSGKEEDPHVALWIESVSATVASGHPLSEAMQRHQGGFASTTLAIVRLGEQTGGLSAMLKQLAHETRRDLDRAAELKAKLTYPIVQLVVAGGLCFLLGTVVGPKLAAILSSFGEEQPALTRLVMTVLSPQHMSWLALLAVLLALTVGFGWSTPAGQQLRAIVLEQIPPVRRLRRDFAMVRFCRNLGLMLECGFNWQHSLALCEASPDDPLAPTIKRFRERISEGDLPDAVNSMEEFPPLFRSLMLSGYESNSITTFLLLYANMLDEALQRRTEALLTILEPLLLAFMGLVVGVIVIASFLPVINLVQKL